MVRIASVPVLVLTAGLLVAACGGKGTAATAASAGCKTVTGNVAGASPGAAGSWPYANLDLANTRNAYGSLTANPIVENGVVYLQDLDSNVYALALATRRLEWEYQCDQPEKSGPG